MTDDEDPITCPMGCRVCGQPGDCEDCLDCLYWPEAVPVDDGPTPTPRGRSLPSMAAAIAAARERLTPGERIALMLRRHRREHGLSQRSLARQLGLSSACVARAEADAGALSLRKAVDLLERIGYRLALVRASPPDAASELAYGEDADTAWPATDLLVRDQQGRRPPAAADVLHRTELDRRLGYGRGRGEFPWWWQLRRPDA